MWQTAQPPSCSTIPPHSGHAPYGELKENIPEHCALWIAPCRAIYTVGMKIPVDIAFLNRRGRVVPMYLNFPPDCLADSSHRGVSAVELAPDTLNESGTGLGDTIEIDPT